MKAYASLNDEGKVILTTKLETGDWFDDMVARSKDVPGARFNKPTKTWRYPLAVETCHRLREVWGDDLTVGADLGQWYTTARQAVDVRVAMASQGDATLVRLPQVAPALFATLRPDQRVGAAWVAAGYRGAGLLCDQPGLGKTLETIAGILESGVTGRVLVVCPKLSVRRVWLREWRKWAPDVAVYAARGTRARRQRIMEQFATDPSELKVLITVAETLRIKEEAEEIIVGCSEARCAEHHGGPAEHRSFWNVVELNTKKKKFAGYEYPWLFDEAWATVVVDESHKLFGSLTIAKGNLAGKGLKRLPVATDLDRVCKLAVTGTPFGKGGRLTGMFGTLTWMWPDEFTSYWRWAETYFEIETEKVFVRGGHGRTQDTRRVAGLRRGSEDDFLNSFGPRILRRTKAEVLPGLPPKQFVEVMCELEGQQLKQYKAMSDEAEITCAGGILTANGGLAEITRAKQVANGVLDTDGNGNVWFTGESTKLDQLFQQLDQRGILDGDGDSKVIVASQYNEFLKVLEVRLSEAKVGYHIITGKTSDTKRDDAMEAFQNDGGHRVFLLNAKAGGVSVTLDAADEVHCLDELWNPEDQEQLEDRAHRASRMHQVTIYHYRSEGTIDENIAHDVEDKRQAQHAVLDGRRGIEYARALIKYRKPADD